MVILKTAVNIDYTASAPNIYKQLSVYDMYSSNDNIIHAEFILTFDKSFLVVLDI